MPTPYVTLYVFHMYFLHFLQLAAMLALKRGTSYSNFVPSVCLSHAGIVSKR